MHCILKSWFSIEDTYVKNRDMVVDIKKPVDEILDL